jgi:thioredoxin
MQEFTADNSKEILGSQGRIALDFFGEWCGPCQKMLPIYTKLDKSMDDITFYKVDVDKNRDAAMQFGVRAIPTVVIIENGKEIGRFSGSMTEEAVKEKLQEL